MVELGLEACAQIRAHFCRRTATKSPATTAQRSDHSNSKCSRPLSDPMITSGPKSRPRRSQCNSIVLAFVSGVTRNTRHERVCAPFWQGTMGHRRPRTRARSVDVCRVSSSSHGRARFPRNRSVLCETVVSASFLLPQSCTCVGFPTVSVSILNIVDSILVDLTILKRR